MRNPKTKVPNKPLSSDIYIVEYPKSGITWLCFLISNSILSNRKDETMFATYYNIQQLIPDIHMSRDIQVNNFWKTTTPRFIKSHHEYSSDYKNIIYLVRDPLSVMISYYKYLSGLDKISMNFFDFVKSKEFGISSWINHVNSWGTGLTNAQKLHIIRYEDLLSKPKDTLAKLFQNLGIDISEDAILRAIALSTFDEMKKSENLFKSNNPFYNLDFVRKGGVINEEVEDDIKIYVENKVKTELKFIL